MTKKILSCFLAILLCALCLVGCSGGEEDAPDGMYSTTKTGEPFILYVPGDWSDNCDSGISSACVISSSAVVSARHYASTLSDNDALKGYVESIDAQYSQIYTEYESVALSSKESLDGKAAVKLQFKFKRGEGEDALNFTVTQYYALHESGIVLLSIYCPTDLYKNYESQFAQIKTEFVLKEADKVTPTVTDAEAPKDMKNASYDGVEYAFYVPTSWKTDMSDKMTEATSADGKCNVTVTCFLSGYEMTVDEYFDLCEEQYKRELGTYKRIDDATKKVHINTVVDDADEKNATTFVYEVTRGEITYKLSQTVLYYNGMFYSITYTALSENFDSHLEDLNLMLKNCSFK